MILRACAILIVGIIIRNGVSHAFSVASRRTHETPIYDASYLKNFYNSLKRHVSRSEITDYEKLVHIEDYPFVVGIVGASADVLGQGSIIGTKWVLTAAHCFTNREKNVTASEVKAGLLSIYSNSTDLTGPHVVKRKIVAFYNHERYNTINFDSDISVVEADRPFDAKYEKPTSFADPKYYYKSFTKAHILGWRGWKLAKAKVYIAPQSSCRKMYRNHIMTPRKICAYGFAEGGCDCDNGGPLYQYGRIVGILSAYTGKKFQISVNVLTKISSFNTFLLSITSGTGTK